jgi:hypothetical protein
LVVDGEQPESVIFAAAGRYVDVNSEEMVFLGIWEPTGENSANLTITARDVEAPYRIPIAIDVADDGRRIIFL